MKRTFSIAQGIGSMISIIYMIALSYIMIQANELTDFIRSHSLVGEQLVDLSMVAHLAVVFIATTFQILAFLTNRFFLSVLSNICFILSWICLPIGMVVSVPMFLFSLCGSVFTKKWKRFSSTKNKQFIKQSANKQGSNAAQPKKQSVQRPSKQTLSSDEMRSKIAQKNPMLQASVDKNNLKKTRIPRFSTSDPEYIHQNNRIPLQMQQANQMDPINPMQNVVMPNMMQYQPYPMQGYTQNYQDSYAMYPNQTMNYGAGAELVRPMNQEPPRFRPKQTISDGYFDDFGKFHPN